MGKDRSTCNIKRADESLVTCDMQHANKQLITRYNHLIQGGLLKRAKQWKEKKTEHTLRSYPLFQADPPLHCLSPKKKKKTHIGSICFSLNHSQQKILYMFKHSVEQEKLEMFSVHYKINSNIHK